MKLSIIIPAHNEEHRLLPMLRAYAAFFATKYGDEVELIVVPNFCEDRTAEIARQMGHKYPQLRVLDDPGRVGKGGAVIAGVKAARGNWIGFVDADGATTPAEFDRLLGVTGSADGVIGSRWMRGAQVTVSQKGVRLLSSRLFNGLIRLLLGLRYTDTQCGAKVFRADVWTAILPKIGITRFAFDVDVLYQIKRHGFTVREEPTVWNDVEGSKVQIMNTSFEMFCAVIRMRLIYSPFRFAVPIYERFFSRVVEFLRRDSLFCHAMVLFIASMVAAVCNVGYQMIAVRALSPLDFALLATFLSLFAIVSRPLGTLATATTHYTSLLMQEGRFGTVKRLVKKWMLIAGGPSVVCSLICVVFARQIADLFHLTRIAPVVVSAAALPALFLTPVVGGALRGMQQFGWCSVASIAGAIVRVTSGAVLILLLCPACGWALLGHASGLYFSLLISVVILLSLVFRFSSDRGKLPSFRLYLAQCVFIQFGMALLMYGDVVFVKHFLPGETDFAKAATLGRMVVFMTGAITMALFPKVSSAGEFTKAHRRLYLRGVAYTALFLGLSFMFCFFFPELLHRFLFRVSEPSFELISQTRWMAVVMGFSVFLGINTSVRLAQRRFKEASVVVGAALLYFGGVQLAHNSVFSIIAVAGVANLVGATVTMGLILKQKTEDE